MEVYMVLIPDNDDYSSVKEEYSEQFYNWDKDLYACDDAYNEWLEYKAITEKIEIAAHISDVPSSKKGARL
jgi:hypothetical protein